MVSALALRGHIVHFVVFGIPVAALVGAVAWQEIRGRLATRDRGRAGATSRPAGADVSFAGPTPALWLAAAGLLAAAVIHAIVIPEHFREDALYGQFFSVLTAAQILLAVKLIDRPDLRVVRYIAIGSAAVVVLYLVSRSSGLPIGPQPWQPEVFGGLDIAATVAELVTLSGCVLQLRAVSNVRRASTSPSTRLA